MLCDWATDKIKNAFSHVTVCSVPVLVVGRKSRESKIQSPRVYTQAIQAAARVLLHCYLLAAVALHSVLSADWLIMRVPTAGV